MADDYDRSHADDYGYLVHGAEAYLGAPELVERLVRKFLLILSDGSADVMTGDLEADELDKRVDDKARELNEVFYGWVQGFSAMPAWNSPKVLGKYLVNEIGVKADPEEAVYRLMHVTANEALTYIKPYLLGEMVDERFQFLINILVSDTISRLLGLPSDPDI